MFELTLTYPTNGKFLDSLQKEAIIVSDANDYLKAQKFRIYNIRKLMSNRLEICARHISFDLAHDWIDRISIENQSCEYALNTIFRNSQFCQHYKGYSDIVNAQNFKVNKVTCLKAIAGTSGSIIDTYGTGAEILRDNTNLHVLNRRGHDNDVVIEYRKNLTGLEVEEDTTDLVTRIMPYAIYTDEDSQEVEVRGDFVDSPLINNYAHPYVKYIDYSDKFENDEVPTKMKLNNLAKKEYTINKVDIPKCNYKIEFIPLSKCAGYEGLEDRINLCDVVTVKDSRYNIDTQAKVIKVTYNVLRDRYESMELGEPKTTLGDIIGGTGNGPMQGPPGPPGPQGPAGADGSIGDFPESLPSVPHITAKVYGFANIELSWTFENKVYYSYELYGSKTKGFVPNTFNLIFSGQASAYLYQAEPDETWYFRACAINTHGQRTEFSAEVKVNTVKISDLSNYVESAAIGDALIGELNLGRGWYGELKGNYIDARQLSVTDGSGKRTLDIDSFGNVNLDVTSLKIKNNSVATESFVSDAKNDAINSANNNTTIALENHYTKSETDSKISVAKDEINLGVSNTYETKANVETMVNSINVGGRNYVRDYMFEKQDVWQRFKTTSAFIDNNNNFGRLSSDSGSVWLYQIMPFETFKKGQVVTIQYEIKCENVSQNTGTNSMLIRTQLTGYDNNGTHIKDVCIFGMHEKEVDNLSEWTKVTVTRTIGDVGVSTRIHLRLYARNFIGKVYFRNVKLELGNKATDLSSAPEDTISDINDAKNEAITSANNTLTTTIANYYTKAQTDSQIKVAKDSITQSVSSTYETKTNVTNKINGVNSSISSLQTRMNTAESKITDTAITNTVKQNFYTKTETENAITSKGYATQSQVQQTADNIQFKFTQTGGYNLIRNGNPKPHNYRHWWVSGNANWYLGRATDIGVQTIDTNEAYAGCATFQVQSGKTYSLSCWLMAETNTKGTDVYFIGSANDDGAYTEIHHLYHGSGDGKWVNVKGTFTLGSNINYGFVRIDNNGRKDTSTGGNTVVFFSEVQMVKGSEYYPQWSPNPNEAYEGIVSLDRDGIEVSASNINGYTKMTANGFFVNKDGKDLVSVDGYGLRLFDAKIQLTHANGNKYFLLDENGIVMYNPANGTHQWGKVAAINNNFTVASNGNSGGLSLGHHVNEVYVEDIYCSSAGVVHVQRQMNHNGILYNNYGHIIVRQSGQGGWEITGRSDSQSIKPGGANQGSLGSNTQYINNSWVAIRNNPSSLEFKHLSHYVDDLECLKLVTEIQAARYFYKEYDADGNDITTFSSQNSQLGLIYEDVRACSGRDLLTNEEDKAINDYNMASVLWGATRNINTRLNEVEYENILLRERVEHLESLLKNLIH